MTRILCGPLLVLAFVLSAAAVSPSRPATRSTLNLPATPYRYANVELPAHFTRPGPNDDNTPPDNPLSDDEICSPFCRLVDDRRSRIALSNDGIN